MIAGLGQCARGLVLEGPCTGDVVLAGVEDFFNSPAQQIEHGYQPRGQIHDRGEEVKSLTALRIDVADPPHAIASVKADEFIGDDALIDFRTPFPRTFPQNDGPHVGFGAGDQPGRAGCGQHLDPEAVIHKARIDDADRGGSATIRSLEQPGTQLAPEHGHFMPADPLALDGSQVGEHAGAQVHSVKTVGRDVIPLLVPGGVDAVSEMMAVDGKDLVLGQSRKPLQEIGKLTGQAEDQLGVEFRQDPVAALGMQGVKESRARDGLIVKIMELLQKVPTAGALADDALNAQTEESEVIERTLGGDAPDEIAEDLGGGGEELVEEQRIGRAEGEDLLAERHHETLVQLQHIRWSMT